MLRCCAVLIKCTLISPDVFLVAQPTYLRPAFHVVDQTQHLTENCQKGMRSNETNQSREKTAVVGS